MFHQRAEAPAADPQPEFDFNPHYPQRRSLAPRGPSAIAKPQLGSFLCVASSFADPADLEAFQMCKAEGKSDQACFKIGDNGVGQFGSLTAQTHTPMVAIHKDDMIARWGSVDAAAHRVVLVTIRGKTIRATVEDRLGVRGRIDLNPAAAKQLGLTPPFLEQECRWRWEEKGGHLAFKS
jgi:hypothetical protein